MAAITAKLRFIYNDETCRLSIGGMPQVFHKPVRNVKHEIEGYTAAYDRIWKIVMKLYGVSQEKQIAVMKAGMHA